MACAAPPARSPKAEKDCNRKEQINRWERRQHANQNTLLGLGVSLALAATVVLAVALPSAAA
jgi:hypothetical protein